MNFAKPLGASSTRGGALHVLEAGSPIPWQHRFMFDLGLIIGGGTAQIQKNIIGERALGLPKEPKYEQATA